MAAKPRAPEWLKQKRLRRAVCQAGPDALAPGLPPSSFGWQRGQVGSWRIRGPQRAPTYRELFKGSFQTAIAFAIEDTDRDDWAALCEGIQEAIEFLFEQLQFGFHQATLQIGDVLPPSVEKSTWSDALPLAHKPRGHLSQFSLVKVAR